MCVFRFFLTNLHAYLRRVCSGGAGAWVAAIQDTYQYLQVDFKKRVIIQSVATQGRMGSKEYVKDYFLKYTDDLDNSNWVFVRDKYGSPYVGVE